MTARDEHDEGGLDEARADLARAIEHAEQLAGGDADHPGRDLVPVRSDDPIEVKRQLAHAQAEIRKQQQVVQRAAERMQEAMEREMARVEAVLAPMRKAVEQLQQGLFSINLYLGRDEQVVLLRDGDSAPADQPIALRQMLLYMDEEMAAAEPEGGFTPRDVEEFDAWLLANGDNLDQVLPESKGIVALRPRRKPPRHDGWRNPQDAEANRCTYWLVRNGERVYRIVTLLELDDRVLPHADEIERLFMRRRPGGTIEAMQPGSHEWERAQDHAEDRERTYLRVGLVLEGLLHRTPIFHPLPVAGVSFLDPRDVRAGKVRYITDAESLLGTGQESFEHWRRRLAEKLQPGMRIVLGPGLRRFNYEHSRGNERLQPEIANLPQARAIYTVESRGRAHDRTSGRTGTQVVFRYREGERWVGDGAWGGGELREPKRRASCTIYAHDEFVLPFDPATVEDMERFLRSRTDRHHYEEMFPILKAAIAAKRREAEIEAPFRTMLAGVLARENQVTVADAEAAVSDLVDWWKLKNRAHRPLLLEAAHPAAETEEEESSGGRRSAAALGMRGRRAQREALAEEAQGRSEHARAAREADEQVERSKLAVRMIVAEHARRLRDARRPLDETLIARLHEQHPHRLVIARPRARGYLVVVAAEPTKNVYVHEHEYTARGKLIESREWVLPRLARTRAWRIIEQDDRWARWDFNAEERGHLRGPERKELREQAMQRFRAADRPLALGARRKTGDLVWWTLASEAEIDNAHLLTGACDGPQIEEHETTWRRTEDGGVTLRAKHATTTRLTQRDRALPWEKREWRSAFDEDTSERPPEADVLARDEATIATLAREFERYLTAAERHAALAARARRLVDSIKAEWLRRQWQAERARFDADFGDAALWPAHRASKERHVRFPNAWDLRLHVGSPGRDPLLTDAVQRLVERGEDPEGRTVGDVLDEATARWGEEMARKDSWHHEDRDGPRKVFTAPDELHDYALSTYQFEHDPDPAAHPTDDDVEPLVDDLLAGVRQALDDDTAGNDTARGYDADAEAVEEDRSLGHRVGTDDEQGRPAGGTR